MPRRPKKKIVWRRRKAVIAAVVGVGIGVGVAVVLNTPASLDRELIQTEPLTVQEYNEYIRAVNDVLPGMTTIKNVGDMDNFKVVLHEEIVKKRPSINKKFKIINK